MVPLADRMRPRTLKEFIGERHLLSEDKLLFKAIKNNQLFSMILWGPPGVGKTSLARLIANETSSQFLEFSAVNTGTPELKRLFEELKREKQIDPSKQTIIFIDEIHRFSKSQQDAFLPYVENGTILLIGATTENPSFEIISPLLSRTRVFVLEPLSKNDLKELVMRALQDSERGLGKFKVEIKDEALEALLELSGGDARKALNALEVAVMDIVGQKKKNITQELVEEVYQAKLLSYDKSGDEHYNTISAFIKSMRASNIDAALYYLARMVEAGEDPLFIARRMVIFASEDIGLSQPTAIVVANEVFRACETIGYPECQINLAHGVGYLAKASKDRSVYDAYFAALEDVKKYGNLAIPLNLRNAPTRLMKDLGYGKSYQMYSEESLLPDKIKDKKYILKTKDKV
ncbi:MAG: replication-associated recombination protein A [Candidatus Daviesbacteria bacterium]|nr:replication-associated recombination protein A [Candidatus Daviesbacteria bacterium]